MADPVSSVATSGPTIPQLQAQIVGIKATIGALPWDDPGLPALRAQLDTLKAQVAAVLDPVVDVSKLTVEQRLARMEANTKVDPKMSPYASLHVYGTPGEVHSQGTYSGAPSPTDPSKRMLINSWGNPINDSGYIIK